MKNNNFVTILREFYSLKFILTWLLYKKIIMFEKLEELAKNNKKISDFHIRSGSPLAYRQTGEIFMVKDVMVKPQDLIDMLTTNCNEHETKKFQDTHEADSAVTISGLRFRANFYKTLNGPAAVLRRVESKIYEMGQFDLPECFL